MATLNYMMEGSAVGIGYSLLEVRNHVVSMITRIQPGKSSADCIKAADAVLGCLRNKAGGYKEFEFSYFHAPTFETRQYRFFLVMLEPDIDDIYRFRPSPEGYLLLLGMLDVDVKDQQILMEKMLRLLIERGRFEQAAEFARRAMVLSVEYRQYIHSQIQQAIRSPRSINWSRVMKPLMVEARQHIFDRQEEEGKLLSAVRDRMADVEDFKTKLELSNLHELLSKAANVRAQLLLEVSQAEGSFLEAQTQGFRARKASGIPDLEAKLFPQILERPAAQLAAAAEDIILSLFPAVIPKTPDLSNILSVLMERRHQPSDVNEDEEESEIVPFEEWKDPFPEAMVGRIFQWISIKFEQDRSWRIDELIDIGIKEGFNPLEQQCIAFCLYRSFPDSESEFQNHHAEKDGEFVSGFVRGDNLRFDTKTNA
jgi:hypothetical protein